MGSMKNMSTHIDKSVIYLFLGVFLIAAITFSFRYAKYPPCDEVLFFVDKKELKAGEIIQFKDKTEGAKEWKWEFGDNTGIFSQKEPLHVFKEEGDYKVRLLVNNTCERIEIVSIKAKVILIDSTRFPVFTLPENIVVGEELKVEDITESAATWEWRFGENASIDAKTRIAEYVYVESGLKTVSLIVNGDLTYIGKKKINVLPLPEEKERITKIGVERRDKRLDVKRAPLANTSKKESEKDKPSVTPFITDINFKNKIKMVSNEKLSPQAISGFFCGEVNPLVVVNGKSTTFLVFCEKIKGKKIKIKSLNLIRNKGSNCIKAFTIEYKKSGLF